MSREEYEYELVKIERLQHMFDGVEGLLIMHLMGFVDWEMEKRLLLKEYEQ